MQKVFIVTTGFYDSIEAVFDNREKAEKIASYLHEGYVKEMTLNDFSKVSFLPWYYIEMEMADGDVITIGEASDEPNISMESKLEIDEYDFLIGYVLAKSKEQAVNIANEKRLQMIANNEWKSK